MIYYLLIVAADALFATQFFFEQRYQRITGNGLTASLLFSGCSFAVITVFMFCLSGFTVHITPFGCLMAFALAAVNILCTYCGIKALKYANLSVYSVFIMLGGMLLPFLLGIFFYDEPFTAGKGVCCLLIAAALILGVKGGAGDRRAVIYYAAIFVLNGLSGVFSKIHQSYPELAVSETELMFLTGCFVVIISAGLLPFAVKKQGLPSIGLKGFLYSGGFGIVNGTAQLITLTALVFIPASVQYPLITGGVMIMSSVISFLSGDKPSKRQLTAIAAAFASVIAVVL